MWWGPDPIETQEASIATYGDARVSASSQSLTIQQEALMAAGCDVIRSEKATGTKLEGRSELETIIQFARAGDSITVTRIDRLARSVGDLATIVKRLEAKGVSLQVIEQPIDTSTAAGRCFLQMLGVLPSLRQPSGVSVRWKVSRKPRPKVSTRVANRPSMLKE